MCSSAAPYPKSPFPALALCLPKCPEHSLPRGEGQAPLPLCALLERIRLIIPSTSRWARTPPVQLSEKPWTRGGAGEGCTSEGTELNQPTPSFFISGSIARAALAGLAGYQIPIAGLCNTSICWQEAGASQLSAGRREGSLTFPARVGCWLCRGYGNAAAAINPRKHPTSSGEASQQKLLQVPEHSREWKGTAAPLHCDPAGQSTDIWGWLSCSAGAPGVGHR